MGFSTHCSAPACVQQSLGNSRKWSLNEWPLAFGSNIDRSWPQHLSALSLVLLGTVHIMTPDPLVTCGDFNNRSPTSFLASQDTHQTACIQAPAKRRWKCAMIFLNMYPLKKKHTHIFRAHRISELNMAFLTDESHTSVTVFMKVFECSSSLVPSSTATDFTNWFPFILRGELITKISRCSAGMDGEAAASCLEPNDWNLCGFVSSIYLRLYSYPCSLLSFYHIISQYFCSLFMLLAMVYTVSYCFNYFYFILFIYFRDGVVMQLSVIHVFSLHRPLHFLLWKSVK